MVNIKSHGYQCLESLYTFFGLKFGLTLSQQIHLENQGKEVCSSSS